MKQHRFVHRLSIGIVVAAIASLPFTACGGSNSGTGTPPAMFYIDAANGDDGNPGTETEPFKTITHAVAAATIGNTLIILPGTYDSANGETFPIVLKEGQHLVGDADAHGIGTTVIGDGSVDGMMFTTAILGADGGSIEGLSIQDSDASTGFFGILAEDAAMTVSACTFGSGYGGIYLEGSGDSVVEDCVFRCNSYGVSLGSVSGSLTIDGNDLEGSMGLPINVFNADDTTTISNNVITGNGQTGLQIQNGNPLITGNTFNYDNPSDPNGYTYGAISCSGATSRVRNNTFDCLTPAILIREGSNVEYGLDLGTASDPGGNDFSDAEGPVISVESGVTATIYAIGNTFADGPPTSGENGDIDNRGSGRVYFTASKFYPFPNCVDAADGDDGNPGTEEEPFKTITHAVAEADAGETIFILPGTYDSANGEVFPIALKEGQHLIGDPEALGIGTTVVGKGPSGIGSYTAGFLGADGASIEGLDIQNTDSDNGYFAVTNQNATMTVTACAFSEGYCGVYLFGTGDSVVRNCVFRNSVMGVYLSASGGVTIDGNDMEGNMMIPISILDADEGTVISNNVITGSGQSGISIQYGNPLIAGNTFNYTNPIGYIYGAISCRSATSRVRNNTFECSSPAILIRSGVTVEYGLDLGTASDPGGNDFSDAECPVIEVRSGVTLSINAVGNTFPNNPPESGEDGDIHNQGSGRVYYTATDYF